MLTRLLRRLADANWFHDYATGSLPGHHWAWRTYSRFVLSLDLEAAEASGRSLEAYLADEIPSWRVPTGEPATAPATSADPATGACAAS